MSNNAFGHEVEDTAVALFQFENSTCATLTVTHAANEPQDTLDIYGIKGSIHIPLLNQGEMTIRIGNTERKEFHPPATNVHQPLIQNFVESVGQTLEPQTNGATGRQVALIIEKIYKSGV